ncbi:Crp/Fnr family transcriptional regulator, partial [Enterococcus faecium]
MSHDHLCVSFVPLFIHLVQQDQEKVHALVKHH